MKKRPRAHTIFSTTERTPYIDEVVEAPAAIIIQETLAFCHGSGPSGHPGVYLNLEANGYAVCPYCNQVFENLPPSEMT